MIRFPRWVLQSLQLLGLCKPLAPEALDSGMPAPDFALADATGATHRLDDYSGRWLVMYFYPKDSTPGCIMEACSFRNELNPIRELGAQVVGISRDDAANHRRFIDKYDLSFPLLSDPDGKVAESYGACSQLFGVIFVKRQTFLIDPDGMVRHVWRKVSLRNHAQEVVAVLERLQ